MTVGSGGDDSDHCCQCDQEDSGLMPDNDDCNSDTQIEVNDINDDYFLAATDGGQRSV